MCGKKFRHPDVYAGRCEDCFAGGCAHQDSVRQKPRKSSLGTDVVFHYNLNHGGSISRVRSFGKAGTSW